MLIEMDCLVKNHTWDLVPRLQGKKIVKFQQVYNTKVTSKGVVECHKVCLVTKTFSQQEVINYTKTFSLVAKMSSVRLIPSLVACFRWKIHQMDVKSAFSHDDLLEEAYMEQSHSFVINSTLVCRLQNLLYGFKQALQDWYAKIGRFFINRRFKHYESNNSLQVLHVHGDNLIVVVYVGDLVTTRNNPDLLLGLKR